MTSANRDSRSEEHPFLHHPTDPESANCALSKRSAAPSNGSWRADAESPPNTDAARQAIDALADWDRYCILAIKADAPGSGKRPASLQEAIIKFIHDAQASHGAVGCPWHAPLNFCALPDADVAAARRLADELHAHLAALGPETVSVGIAPFPLLAYDKKTGWANAGKALDHAAFLGPGSIVALDAVTLNISGDQYYQAGQLDQAVAEYTAALALDPKDINVHNSLGVCFAEMHDTGAARSSFTRASEIAPDEPMPQYNLGMLCLLENQIQPALAHFQKANTNNCGFYEIPFQIGAILSDQCRWQDALTYADEAITLEPDNGTAHGLKGQCLAALEKIPQAIQAYTRAVKINPNNADALSALGCLYDAQNENPDICKTFLEQGVSLAPDNGLYHHRLGQWLQKHDQIENALATYRQALALGHNSLRQIKALQSKLQNEKKPAARRAG